MRRVRFDLATADNVETDLRDAFAYNRNNFLNAVEASFNRRQLDAAAVALPEFRRVIASFKKQQPAFPLSANLTESWAGGDAESPVLASLIEQMRAVMARPIRPDAWPENLRLGYHVRLVSVSNDAEAVTLEIADARGVTHHGKTLRFLEFERFGGFGINHHQWNGRHDVVRNRVADAVIGNLFGGNRSTEKQPKAGAESETGHGAYHRKDFCSPTSWSPSQRLVRHAVTSPKFL
jgi:hypothetical protein